MNLLPFPVEQESASADLSKATKLRGVFFLCGRLGTEWISMTLRTITPDHRDLQRISISLPSDLTSNHANPAELRHAIGEVIYKRWLELDRLLIQLWESHSIRPKLLYYAPSGKDEEGPRSCVESLLPEIMGRGLADLVNRRWQVVASKSRAECCTRGEE